LSLDSLADGLGAGGANALESLRRRASAPGTRVYLVGGPVRDLLLGAPVKDLDFAVEGDAPALAQAVALETGGVAKVHRRFGTATVWLRGDQVDFATARREEYPQPGALPKVTPCSMHEDLARRDFSVNAMALPLSGAETLLDPMGGRADLASGVIRTLHRRSFIDDPTRLLRAVRYEQRFGFSLDGATMLGLREALDSGAMAAVDGDRWRHELERIFGEKRPLPALFRAVELGLLAGISPRLTSAPGLARLRCERKRAPAEDSAEDCLAALVCTLSDADAEGFVSRFKLPRNWARLVRDTIKLRDAEGELAGPSLRTSALACKLDARYGPAVAAWRRLTTDPVVAENIRRYIEGLESGTARLTGFDVMGLGVPQGPLTGEVLRRLRDARLDGLTDTVEDERRLVQALMSGENPPGHE
jgi:tRNA nucleotidyltransferase (CCA-adding enzyme)